MSSPRTCTQCGRQIATAQLWRKLMGRMGWRITCPSCGKIHDIAARERFISSLYFAVLPGLICTVGVSVLSVPVGHLARGALIIGVFLVVSTIGTWFAARRLRLG